MDDRLLQHISKLPEPFRCIIFCEYHKLRSPSASSACNVSIYKYERLKDILKIHVDYYRIYLDNKKKFDKIFREQLTPYQWIVFKDLLNNPFQKSKIVAKRYKVQDSAVRVLIHSSFKKLKSDDIDFNKLIKLFKMVVFGKKKRR